MRILLCEDEHALADALAVMLKHNKYAVDVVYNGADALDYLQADNYDAVILDIMMPKVDGLTVLRKIRAQGNMVPVLMLTARSLTDDKVTGLDAGANDYLTKPFEIKELLARLRAMTRTVSDATSSVLRVGNVSLDRATFVLKGTEGEFRLANKEYQLMETLMMNEKQILPTERLMEKIWGLDSDSEINVVWVYISYLRKKLVAIGANIQIKVTRNIGYSLEEK